MDIYIKMSSQWTDVAQFPIHELSLNLLSKRIIGDKIERYFKNIIKRV